jgi:diphosphomevalonate decarboxylase
MASSRRSERERERSRAIRIDGNEHAMTVARACANVALVKYWGKRDAALNFPATGSLSIALAALVTETAVELDDALADDAVELDGAPATGAARTRVVAFLELVRARAGATTRARVRSANRFPTASGLASSASGFAALATAAARAYGLAPSPRELSQLARRGSGSAARSIFGGFVAMHAGERDADAYAEPIASPLADRARVVIAIVGGGAVKPHASRDAMVHVAETSPLYAAWLELVPRDLVAARAALAAADLPALGAIAEANALAMHATAIAARPAIVYWRPETLAVLARVRALRDAGRAAWATIDAGPHVKVLTDAADAEAIARALADEPGVTAATISAVGSAAEIVA